MHRFYADPDQTDEHLFVLNAEDARHAGKVLRLRPGDETEVFWNGQRFLAALESLSADRATLCPLSVLPSTEPFLSVTLFQGLPKSDKMDWIVQKSVELGVLRIVPVVFSRCVVRLDEKESARKQERWQRIAREAGKQSGRCRIPEVCSPVLLSALPSCFAECDSVAVPWEECVHGGPLAFVREHPSLSSLGVVIGPEGGISADEIRLLSEMGCETVTLGRRILRTETAGLAALSVFFGLYGEME